MSVSNIIREWSRRDTIPVEVSTILDEIRGRRPDDIINFFQDIELDTKVIQGFLDRRSFFKDGRQRFVSVITYGSLDPETERLVQGKELIHILDPEPVKVSENGRLKQLIEKMSLPAALVDPFDEDEALNDRLAILEAVAIMFPMGARGLMYQGYITNKLSLNWIAQQAELPPEYVSVVMQGYWPKLVDNLIARRVRLENAAEQMAAGKPASRRRNPARPIRASVK